MANSMELSLVVEVPKRNSERFIKNAKIYLMRLGFDKVSVEGLLGQDVVEAPVDQTQVALGLQIVFILFMFGANFDKFTANVRRAIEYFRKRFGSRLKIKIHDKIVLIDEDNIEELVTILNMEMKISEWKDRVRSRVIDDSNELESWDVLLVST